MLKLGSHVSFSSPRYLASAAEEALLYNANAMMIYLGAPQNTKRVEFEKMHLEEYEQKYAQLILKSSILVHAPYIINPASVEKHQFAIDFLVKEIQMMNKLGLTKLVLHPGAHTSFTRNESLAILIKSLKIILQRTEGVSILLETMSGKGTELGTTFEELVHIIQQVNSDRIGICLDTCHMWDAGYQINDFDAFIAQLKATNAYQYVQAIHINDSKNELGASKDRHENIGHGNIGLTTLKNFVNSPVFDNIIKVLETPYVDGKPIYKQEIEMLKL